MVTTQLLHAAGIALAAKMRKKTRSSCLTSCGEGSTSKGDFHEALNFAAIHKLPVIFYVENNGYAISEPTEKEMPVPNVADRARGYGMQSAMVDGMDCIAVYQTVRPAVDQARRGGGPVPDRGEVLPPLAALQRRRRLAATARRTSSRSGSKKDPLTLFRGRVEKDGIFPQARISTRFEQRVDEEVREAAQWALMQPDPEPEDALGFVYKEAR